MTLFFTADTHFDDHRTINIHERPFANLKMDELVLALEGARNEIAGIEARSIEELEELARQRRDSDHAAPRS